MPLHHHRSAGLAPSILVAALVLLLLVPVDAFHPRLPQRPLTSATTITSTTAASRPATANSKTPPPSFRRSSASSPLFSGGSHTSKPPILRDPDESYLSAVELGVHKATEPAPVIFLLGIQAGLQVGLGAAMAAATWAGVPGIQASNPGLAKLIYGFCGLPCGLLLTATTGTMLFTGNTAIVSLAWMEKKVKFRQLVKSWVWSYLGNMLGAALLAGVCTYAGVFKSAATSIVSLAAYKAAMPFGVLVARGVLCNYLVCMAVWVSQAAADLVSKATAIVLIITIFASLSFEHSVANMFIGPFAALNGGPSYLYFFLRNLVPVTIGNIFAGVVLVAFSNYLSFGSGSKRWRKGGKEHGKGFGPAATSS